MCLQIMESYWYPMLSCYLCYFDDGGQPEEYINECYSKAKYLSTYEHTLQPINGENEWPKTRLEEMLPPLIRSMSSRPKRKRVPKHDEPRSNYKLSRKRMIMTCKLANNQDIINLVVFK